eukprot:7379842-Prymnesium_polylepis.2
MKLCRSSTSSTHGEIPTSLVTSSFSRLSVSSWAPSCISFIATAAVAGDATESNVAGVSTTDFNSSSYWQSSSINSIVDSEPCRTRAPSKLNPVPSSFEPSVLMVPGAESNSLRTVTSMGAPCLIKRQALIAVVGALSANASIKGDRAAARMLESLAQRVSSNETHSFESSRTMSCNSKRVWMS